MCFCQQRFSCLLRNIKLIRLKTMWQLSDIYSHKPQTALRDTVKHFEFYQRFQLTYTRWYVTSRGFCIPAKNVTKLIPFWTTVGVEMKTRTNKNIVTSIDIVVKHSICHFIFIPVIPYLLIYASRRQFLCLSFWHISISVQWNKHSHYVRVSFAMAFFPLKRQL